MLSSGCGVVAFKAGGDAEVPGNTPAHGLLELLCDDDEMVGGAASSSYLGFTEA